jgi:ATP-dependent DNA helicase RecG
MLTTRELEKLLQDLESDRVERKANATEKTVKEKIAEAICAFSNDLPNHQESGIIFIGVSDKGKCLNLPITDNLLKELADLARNGTITPPPMVNIEKKGLGVCEVAVVEVLPAYSPPVRYNGRVFVRIGPTTRIASIDEERLLAEKRRAGDVPFDRQPIRGATLDDLRLEFFRETYLPNAVAPEVLAANGRTVEEQLLALGFVDKNNIPNAAAILVLGKNPRNWIGGASVQFLRISGTSLADPIILQKELALSIPELLKEVNELLSLNIQTKIDINAGATEKREYDYPVAALRQLIYNGILHRSYESYTPPLRIYWFDDRVEIISPGGPYGILNTQNFGKSGLTSYRNLRLADAMKVLGFVQQFGVGIETARRELRQNGNPELEYEVDPAFIIARVRIKP